ncbi:MAG TPA: TlpA disulfide reductase family protein [Bacteroidia bacterium]|jgi:peroxiredoxin|nr:TlpA disulfide reductase family protein [Bacteroidia bacterium]
MKFLRIYISAFIVLLTMWVQAQPATIEGYAPAYMGKTVYLSTCKDFITYTPLQLASTAVNDSGKFKFQLEDLKRTTYVYLTIQNYKGDLYAVPGNYYRVVFPAPDSDHYQNKYIEHKVNLELYIDDSAEVNNLIMDFNVQFEKFWAKTYTYFLKKEAPRYVDSFYTEMLQRYKSIHNPDFSGYMAYTIAEIGNNILEGQRTLGEKYLKGKPIRYNNYEYMQFFNDYFKDYMQNCTNTKEGSDINKFIAKPDYPDLMEVLKINHLLRNDSLCELVLLKGLYEFYYSGGYDQENIISLLKTVSGSTKIEEDKIIADDMIASFSGVVKGGNAPDFALKDSKGDVSSIIDFRGKLLYLCFFKTTSSASVSQMEVLPALYKQYGKKINFVFISEDENYSDLINFLKANRSFTWNFLWDEKHTVMQQYDVKTLPEYFLIGTGGKFLRSPADDPSHGIENTFNDLTRHVKDKDKNK